jgi:hypothetical protein
MFQKACTIIVATVVLLTGAVAVASTARSSGTVWHDDRIDPLWQWSVRAPTIPDRRAFLWIAPDCKHVRGIVIGLQNMLETPLFERAAFRSACAANDLAIVMVYSGHDRAPGDEKSQHPNRSYLDIFLNPDFPKGGEQPKLAGEDLQRVLDALANESGYAELSQAPLLPMGHSSAGSFVWHLYEWDPSRIFAMMPFKTGLKNDGPSGIPIFDVNSEWFDYGNRSSNVSTKPSDFKAEQLLRHTLPDAEFGMYVDIGAGHCDVSDDSIPIVAQYLKTVTALRIPEHTKPGKPVPLKPVDIRSGWLIAPADLGKAGVEPVAYDAWHGDPRDALWYPDHDFAEMVQTHMIAQYAKNPQQMNFVKEDGSVPTSGGTFNFRPQFIDDLGTFQIEAKFIDELQDSDVYPPGTKLQHGNDPIFYRVNSGAVRQIGPNTFRIMPHAGPIVPQGNPWEPTLVAYCLGDNQFRPTERPAHVNVNIVNSRGEPQTIDFPSIPDQAIDSASPIRLGATASSGLPVQYFVVSGPVRLRDDGESLELVPLPVRMKTPARVLVGAFQWGRPSGSAIRSAGPVIRQFWVLKPHETAPPNSTQAPAAPAAR